MLEAGAPQTRSLSSALFLGDRSPYGLSVARALLGSRLRPRLVVVPSDRAHEAARRSARRRRLRGLPRRLRGGLGRRIRMAAPPASLAASGEPIQPLVLDPGITLEALQLACASAGVAWLHVDEIRSEKFARLIRQTGPDLILCAAFPLLLGKAVLAIPSVAAVNFHPSLLPRCRGCHPIFWTLASGETQGGVTAHFMTRQVDAGDIVAQIPLPLTEEDDYTSLYRRAMGASDGLVQLVESFFLSGLRRGIPQDRDRATYFHEDTEEDHRVRWGGLSPHEIAALARTGAAFTFVRGHRVGILKATEMRTVTRERRVSRPGRVIAVNEETLVVSAAGGAVAVHSVAWRGLKHRAGDLARAFGLRRGAVLA